MITTNPVRFSHRHFQLPVPNTQNRQDLLMLQPLDDHTGTERTSDTAGFEVVVRKNGRYKKLAVPPGSSLVSISKRIIRKRQPANHFLTDQGARNKRSQVCLP